MKKFLFVIGLLFSVVIVSPSYAQQIHPIVPQAGPAISRPACPSIAINYGDLYSASDTGVVSQCNSTGWTTIGSGGGGAVSSVFGRAGAVVATTGDYTCAQVTSCISSTGVSGMTSGQVAIAGSSTTITSSEILAGSGAGITTGPINGVTSGHVVDFTGTGGQIADANVVAANLVVAVSPGAGVAHFAGSTQTVTSSAVSLTADVSGILPSANGGTGVNNTATLTLGSSNQNWATLGTGIVKNTTTTGAITDAASADVIGLFSGSCSSSTFLRGDGSCNTPSGSGTVSSLTTGYIPKATGSTALSANSNCDVGITTVNVLTCTDSGGLALTGSLSTGGASATFGTGGGIAGTEGTIATGKAGQDICAFVSANHSMECSYNNGSFGAIPNATTAPLSISVAGNISITGVAGEVLAGASPAFTATPALGTDNSVAGTLQLSNGSANAHTIFSSGATTTNTIAGFTAVATAHHLVACEVASTTCTLTDSGITDASPTGSGAIVLANTPTLITPVIGAATGTSLLATGIVDGTAPVTITTGTTANLGGTYNSGYTMNQEATAGTGVTYTLPATAVGKQYCVKNSGTTGVVNTGVLTVYPPSGSYVINKGVVNTVGGGGTHGVASAGAADDAACFVAIDSTHWQVFIGSGTWTNN